MISGVTVFEWLAGLERLDAPTERQAALRNGWPLAQLVVDDQLIVWEGADHFAQVVAELQQDGWVAWDFQSWPGDPDPPTPPGFRMQHLQRCDRIRITPEGYAAGAARRGDVPAPAPKAVAATRDVFISHAGEDKQEVARPLAEALVRRGYSVWFDEYELGVGDSLRRSIDAGLRSSRFGLVILSPSFFTKPWPQRELDGLVARATGEDLVILPVWHRVQVEDVRRFSPPLADLLAAVSDEGIDAVADRVAHALNRRAGVAGRGPAFAGAVASEGAAAAPDDPRGFVLDALKRNDAIAVTEFMREERRVFRTTVRDKTVARVAERPTEESIRGLHLELVPVFERRLAGLLPLVDYDPDQFEREIGDLARLLDDRPAVDGFAFWLQMPEWATWWLTHALGAYALREWATRPMRALLAATYDDRGKTRPVASGFPPDAGVDIGKLVVAPPEGAKAAWISAAWELLVRSLSQSSAVARDYPEFADWEVMRGALGSWDFVLCLSLGLREHRSLAHWDLGGRATTRFGRRLHDDDHERERLAREVLAVSLTELDQAAGAALARSKPMSVLSSGGAADAFLRGEE